MKSLLLFFMTIGSGVFLAQVESGVLDGIYVQEHIPTKQNSKTYSLIYIEELQNEQLEDISLTNDSLQLHYIHSSYGLIFKDTMLNIPKDHFIISNLQQSNLLMKKLAYRYTLVLANFCDRITIEQDGQEIFEISYYNFVSGSERNSYFLFNELLSYMRFLCNETHRLENPMLPNSSTD